jgi:hypothetical protein
MIFKHFLQTHVDKLYECSLTCSSTAERMVGNTSWGSIYKNMLQQTFTKRIF